MGIFFKYCRRKFRRMLFLYFVCVGGWGEGALRVSIISYVVYFKPGCVRFFYFYFIFLQVQ